MQTALSQLPSGAHPLAYSIPDAARTLGIGRTTLYSLIGSGAIGTVNIGRRRVVPHDELVRYVDQLKKAE